MARAGGIGSPAVGRLTEVFVAGDADGATPFRSLLDAAVAAPHVDVRPDDVALLPC